MVVANVPAIVWKHPIASQAFSIPSRDCGAIALIPPPDAAELYRGRTSNVHPNKSLLAGVLSANIPPPLYAATSEQDVTAWLVPPSQNKVARLSPPNREPPEATVTPLGFDATAAGVSNTVLPIVVTCPQTIGVTLAPETAPSPPTSMILERYTTYSLATLPDSGISSQSPATPVVCTTPAVPVVGVNQSTLPDPRPVRFAVPALAQNCISKTLDRRISSPEGQALGTLSPDVTSEPGPCVCCPQRGRKWRGEPRSLPQARRR